MSELVASVLLTVALVLGVTNFIDWINRVRIRWNMRRVSSNQTHTDWEFIKHILRRHGR
jgi:Tfp pilus assembly protein FimT